jgi:hypothetical protein
MKLFLAAVVLTIVAFHSSAAAQQKPRSDIERPFRALLIVAYPDDEYEMAATVYRIAQELAGWVDSAGTLRCRARGLFLTGLRRQPRALNKRQPL